MTKPAILAIGPYPLGEIDRLAADYVVHRYWEAADKAALLKEHGPAIRAIVTRGDLVIDKSVYPLVPKLEMVSVYGVGVDGVDLDWCRARKIRVANTPDLMTEEVADIALMLMLSVTRKQPQGDRHVRSGTWAETGNMPLTPRFYGKRLGIAGLGRIGKAIARRAEGFGMRIAYHGRKAQAGVAYPFVADLAALAGQSDYLVAAMTGGAATAGLISAEVLKALGPDGFFINVARGTVVDEPALLAALENNTIAGAGLDVFCNEPKIDPRFYAFENTAYMPHVGSATIDTRKAMGQMMRDNLAAHFAGKPLLAPVV